MDRVSYRAILIVAAPSLARALLTATLQSRGYSVSATEEPHEAERLARLEPPDLVITAGPSVSGDRPLRTIVARELAEASLEDVEPFLARLLSEVEQMAPPPLNP